MSYTEYKIKKHDGTEIVSGKPVILPGFKTISAFIRKINGLYIISEVSTGYAIATDIRHKTQKETIIHTCKAIRQYNKRHGVRAIQKRIAEIKKQIAEQIEIAAYNAKR